MSSAASRSVISGAGRMPPAPWRPAWKSSSRVRSDRRLGSGAWGVVMSSSLRSNAEAEIVGFTRFGPTRDEDDDPAQVGEIASIYLLPQAWGTGLGRRLMSSALRHLAGAGYGQATLWVLDPNARARRFYAKGGWAEDGAVKQDDSLGFPMAEVRYRRPLRRSELRRLTSRLAARGRGE